ncbi:uncharacterized protein [Ptychodera flava]|uniref:uncharacterized protein isoform X3 n=1 Tax=Ptychodera flava TaxID=63121 RepID=UPI00396AAE64
MNGVIPLSGNASTLQPCYGTANGQPLYAPQNDDLNNESTLQLPRETTPVQCIQTQPVPGSPRNCDPDPDRLTSQLQLHRATQNQQPMSHWPYGNCDAKSTATKEAIYQAEKM